MKDWYVIHFLDGEDVLVRALDTQHADMIARNYRLKLGRDTSSTHASHVPDMERVWQSVARAFYEKHGIPNQEARKRLDIEIELT